MLVPLGAAVARRGLRRLPLPRRRSSMPRRARISGTGSIAFDAHLDARDHEVPLWVKLSAPAVMLIGFADRLLRPISATPAFPARFVAQFGVLYAFLLNKWYFDELYNVIFVRPSFWLGRLLLEARRRGHDRPLRARRRRRAGRRAATRLTARLQSGYLYTYALVMLLGLAAAATWAMAR